MTMQLWGCTLAAILTVGLPAPAGDATPTARVTSELAEAVIGDIVPEVARVRKLDFRESVPVEVIDDATARRHVLSRAEGLDLQDQIAAAGTAYRLLGLVGPDDDLLELYLGALDEQAGGFYDPERKRFFLLDDMPAAAIEILTAHELTHALEDQHFDLDSRIEAVIDDDDRLFARSAVHEGSATLVMTVYAAQAMLAGKLDPVAIEEYEDEFGQGEVLAALPPILLRQMLGPYVLGAGFLARGDSFRVVQNGFPVADVNQAYADSPSSSEQILHPEKYWDERDEPLEVDLAGVGDGLGKRFRRTGGGTLGELSLAVMVGGDTPTDPMVLMTRGATAWTHPAAEGWGGDRWELWQKAGAAVVVALTAWDSETDAVEFERAVGQDARLRVGRADSRVAIVAGASGKRADRLLDALLAPGRVGPATPSKLLE